MTTPTAGVPREWVGGAAATSSPDLFAATLLIACALHLILLLGVSFVVPKTSPGRQATRPLEVIVLRQAAPSDEKPETADAFAQVDRAGGGMEETQKTSVMPQVDPMPQILEPDTEHHAVEPIPPPLPEPAQAARPQLPAAFEEQPLTATLQPKTTEPPPAEPEREVLTSPESEPALVPELQPPKLPVELPPEPAPPQITAAQILTSRNLEIAALAARIQHSSAAYANRPRRKAVSASTREYKYATYLEAWRRKVERVGNLNYPEEAKRHKMYGNLILHVAVRADGNIERIRVLRSSGFDLLDEAAVKIVELSAPFAPFPPDIRAETDILDITRTWQFLSSNRLGWEN